MSSLGAAHPAPDGGHHHPASPPKGAADHPAAGDRGRTPNGGLYSARVSEIDRLAAGKYLLVTTFRRDGRAVPTPVWAARDGEALLVWTVTDSGKVKRIRRDGHVTLAPCTSRGRATGTETPGHAEILDAEGTARARRLIAGRYGPVGRLVMLGSRMRRGDGGTVGIRLTVDTGTGDPDEAGTGGATTELM